MISALNDLHNLVKNKSVAVVGGGRTATAHEIDEASRFDLILSVHNHAHDLQLQPDIIFTGWVEPILTDRTKVVCVNIANPDSHNTLKACAIAGVTVHAWDSLEYCGVNPNGPEFEWSNIFAKELCAKPFSGVMALRLLLSLPVREVFVTGFTFYSTAPGVVPRKVASHLVEAQADWFRRVLETDERVSIDSEMKRLFLMGSL